MEKATHKEKDNKGQQQPVKKEDSSLKMGRHTKDGWQAGKWLLPITSGLQLIPISKEILYPFNLNGTYSQEFVCKIASLR